MAEALSMDLRGLLRAIAEGASGRSAGRRFGVSARRRLGRIRIDPVDHQRPGGVAAQPKGSRIPTARLNPPHAAKAMHSNVMFADRL
jgi:hypothetical protein